MRNLWIFINKYSAFFLFILFFGISVILILQKNSFQRASFLNSSNYFVGNLYSKINNLKSYLHLNEDNTLLSQENASLRSLLKSSQYSNKLITGEVRDSLQELRYTFLEAKVINNSIHQKNNTFTISRGAKHGVKKGMGVIASKGVAGIVLQVSEHFSIVQSFLNSDTKVSSSLVNSHAFGSLVWGENNLNPKTAILKDIPNHIKVVKGEKVVTSGFSLFPEGILLGKVIEPGLESGDSFLNISVALDIDFSSLQYVYVVTDKLAEEKTALEEKNKENG
jgi:rod shape-determining protein MreC